MNVSALTEEVYLHLAEAQIGNDRVTEAKILVALNIIYERVALAAHPFVETVLLDVSAGIQGVFTLPAGMFALRAVRAGSNAVPLQRATISTLDYHDTAWRGATPAEPTHVYLVDHRKFGVYPPPRAADTPITVEGFMAPLPSGTIPTLTTGTDVPRFLPSYHRILVMGAVEFLCAGFLKDVPTAAEKMQWAGAEYTAMLQAMQALYATGLALQPQGA